MSSILSGTVKLAGWTLAAAIVASAFVSSQRDGDSLRVLRTLLTSGSAEAPIQAPEAQPEPQDPPQLPLQPPPEASHFGDEVELTVGAGGNFHTTAEIDGMDMPMVVDTGASAVVLSSEQAGDLGFRPLPSEFRYVSQTANGKTYFARITLPYIRVGPIEVHNVDAMVGEQGAIGQEGLLGMTFLNRLRSYRVSYGRLILEN